MRLCYANWGKSGPALFSIKGGLMARTGDDSWNLAGSVGATATMVAAARAVAARGPSAAIDDPFAQALVRAVGVEFFTKLADGDLEFEEAGTPWPSHVFGLRTHYFDEFLTNATKDGIRQAVILASGLDSRGYRLSWPTGAVVYEVDQPPVIEFKSTAMQFMGARPTADLRAVGIDLRHDWPKALLEAGFRRNHPTVWSVEGLLMGYLPNEAEQRLLDEITALSAPGSRLGGDYLKGTADAISALMRTAGQKWQPHGFTADFSDLFFHGHRDDIVTSLKARGWHVAVSQVASLLRAAGAHQTADELSNIDMAYVTCSRF
jgi:methyltransferase (TIGR00027 family)